MKHRILTKSVKSIVQTALVIVCTIVFTLIGLLAVTRYDNKYITKAPLTQDQLCLIPENGYCALVDGWELYPDVLLSPDDFSSETPPFVTTWAGEYPSLALFHADKNPYGTATWRLHLQGSGSVTLYLQEPLCATRVFVDGRFLGDSGNVSPQQYSPLIKDAAYSFSLNGTAELIIQTANYSHYYGGIWYAPVIGDTDSMNRLIAVRMLFYGLLFFPSLTLSLFCIVLWGHKESGSRPAAFYFGILSLSFALRICYPFFRMFGVPLVRPLYALEDTSAMLGIFCSLQIAFLLFMPNGFKRLKSVLRTISLSACGIVFVVPLFVLPVIPTVLLWYGALISWYKIIMAGVLISLTVYGCFMGFAHVKTALAAATANGLCLFYGVWTIGTYEPFIGAYPEEYGAFGMVLAFAVLMVQRSREMAEENRTLRLHLQDEVQEKTRHLQELLAERGQLIAELGHDMKSPLTSLSNMAQIIRRNDIMLDSDVRKRMLHIEEQCALLSERLKSIQEIAALTGAPPQMEPMVLNTFLSDFYHNCQPIIELYGPDFLAEITPTPCHIIGNSERLFRALENLLYNAADFTPPDGAITLSLTADEAFAYICISDTGCGIAEADLPHIFKQSYTTRTDKGGQGLGLAITRTIVLEHSGKIDVVSKTGEGTAFTICLPLVTQA